MLALSSKKCIRIMILMTFFRIFLFCSHVFDACLAVSGCCRVLHAELCFERVYHVAVAVLCALVVATFNQRNAIGNYTVDVVVG